MNGISLYTLLLCAVALLPALVACRIVAMELKRRNAPRFTNLLMLWGPERAEENDTQDEHLAFERTHHHLRRTAQLEVDRPLKAAVHEFVGDTASNGMDVHAFEYTIKPQECAVMHKAMDMGGFAQVPLLLYDRAGNCFTVHRRLSLN
jgi:hypothetical protein